MNVPSSVAKTHLPFDAAAEDAPVTATRRMRLPASIDARRLPSPVSGWSAKPRGIAPASSLNAYATPRLPDVACVGWPSASSAPP